MTITKEKPIDNIVDAFSNHVNSMFLQSASRYNCDFLDVLLLYGSLNIKNITIEDIKDGINRLEPTHSVGPDRVPVYIYKVCSEFFIYPFSIIFNSVIVIPAVRKLLKFTRCQMRWIKVTVGNTDLWFCFRLHVRYLRVSYINTCILIQNHIFRLFSMVFCLVVQ